MNAMLSGPRQGQHGGASALILVFLQMVWHAQRFASWHRRRFTRDGWRATMRRRPAMCLLRMIS